jgi:ATP-dependent Clp protease ATP-binding subunit ClpX
MGKLRCSLCRKSEEEVEKLVAGPRVCICEECVALADQIMKGDIDRAESSVERPTSTLGRIVARIRNLLGGDAQRVQTELWPEARANW